MKRRVAIKFLFLELGILLVSSFILIGCSLQQGNTPPPSSNPVFTSSPTPSTAQAVFTFRRFIWRSDGLFLFGDTTLPDQTHLDVQLYQNENALDWWPSRFQAYVTDGMWEGRLMAGAWQAPPQLPDFTSGYSFHIWDDNNWSTQASFALTYPEPEATPTSDLKSTKWNLITLNARELISGSTISAHFDVENPDRIWGNTGVNFYGCRYETSSPSNIIIYDTQLTLIGGPSGLMDQEEAYLKCLRHAASYNLIDNHLEIFDTNQVRLLVFERTS